MRNEDGDALAPHVVAARPAPARGLARRLALDALLSSVLGDRPLPCIGRYTIERKAGAGGMGVVYRGREEGSGRAVAIKVLERGAVTERARFDREARLLRTLEHHNVVRYLAHGTTNAGVDYLVMEWLEGRDLGARIRHSSMRVSDALTVTLGAARGLAAVHRSGIIHRDVKPTNLFIVDDELDDVRVVDFGVSRSMVADTRVTSTGAIVGTPHYMAPEQLRGNPDVRSDVYGLGATLFECLAGRPPYAGEHPAAVLSSILADAVPSVAAIRPEVSPALDALVARMLAKDAADRPADMNAVVAEVAQLLSAGTRPTVVLSRLERSPSPRRAGLRGERCAIVGRARELALVAGAVEASLDEEESVLVIVSGEAGIGKSAVLRSIAEWAAGLDRHATIVATRAPPDAIGAPFALVRSMARAIASVAPGGEQLDAARVRLLELTSAACAPDGSEGAHDVLQLADAIALAWLDLVEAVSERGPLVAIVDDAHASDLASLRLLRRALAFLEPRAFALVAAARSESALTTLVSTLDEGRMVGVALGPLGARSSARLASRWAENASDESVARMVALAGGNPMRLQDLAHAEGPVASAASMVDRTWQRFSGLDPEARRVLRAASVVGRDADVAALAHLLGVETDDAGLARRIEALVQLGVLRREEGREELGFASELVHRAAYELNTDEDLARAHRAMSEWLRARPGSSSAATLARHLRGAGEDEEASHHYLAVARAALAGGDVELFATAIANARERRVPNEVAGALHALEARAWFWRGSIEDSLMASFSACAALPRGSSAWFSALSHAITSAGQLGDDASVLRLAREALAQAPHGVSARATRVVAVARARSQLFAHDASDELTSALESIASDATSAEASAWLHRGRAIDAAARGFDAIIGGHVEAHRSHVEEGDMRSAAQLELYLATFYVWSGAWERAREAVDDALRIGRRLDAAYLDVWGRYVMGKLAAEIAEHDEARAVLTDVVERSEASPRIRTGALLYASLAALRAGDAALAEVRAREALGPEAARAVAPLARAALVRSLLAQGRASEAEALLLERTDPARKDVQVAELDELIPLAVAELAVARSEASVARDAIARAVAAIRARARTLANPVHRNHYLARPHLVRETFALARAHGVDSSTP